MVFFLRSLTLPGDYVMSINLRPELAIFLGNVNGQWARKLRKKLKLNPEMFWMAIGVSGKDGKSYETSRAKCLPVVVVTSIVYVHIYQLPMIFLGQEAEVKDALLSAVALSRTNVIMTREEKLSFLGYHC